MNAQSSLGKSFQMLN